ncbi:MAG: HEAT repeat domain-containing protein [Treponema sp.]|nr:HEAT repeat domain-containing protein [Treponema sp.]
MTKKIAVPVFCFLILAAGLAAQTDSAGVPEDIPAPPAEKTAAVDPDAALAEQRLRVIRYGTDTEISSLIRALRAEKTGENGESPLDGELQVLAEKTGNRAILSGVFAYFGERKKTGLEDRARRAVEERDDEAAETVLAAIDYLGMVRAGGCSEVFTDILKGEETRYLAVTIRAMGRCANGSESAGETAAFLIEYYRSRDPADENRREIILALGEARSGQAVELLVTTADSEDERATLRMAALDSIAKIADERGLEAALKAVSSKDPNVRSAAIGALAPFEGARVEEAVIEAFRDSYYRSRIAAAASAAERKIAAAVPFLRFRAENDEVPSVKDEAIKALGAIGTREAVKALEDLFNETKNPDRVRVAAAEMLLAHNESYTGSVIAAMDDAKARNQTALYNGLLKDLGTAKLDNLRDLAARLFAGGGVIEKSYAIDICATNDYRDLAGELRKLADPKNGALSRKSLALLKTWGMSAEEPAEIPADGETPEESAAE